MNGQLEGIMWNEAQLRLSVEERGALDEVFSQAKNSEEAKESFWS
ncbi:hypothetical protein [Paenibacillus koleovorans]|nr:hypothetical protein [Paenibacillus koleovorans]